MENPKPLKFPVVAWTPFFDRGKFMYWVMTGRGETIIGKDGKPRTKFYHHSHATGGSIWTRVLPEGETPEGLPGDVQEPSRPAPIDQPDDTDNF
jgi:hypothetical protein